jgi:hypothetical protein
MERYAIAEAAGRAGVDVDGPRRLVELGIVSPGVDDRLSAGGVRRVGMVSSLVATGIGLEGLGTALRSGQVSLDFLDGPDYERFSALTSVTFAEFADRNARRSSY